MPTHHRPTVLLIMMLLLTPIIVVRLAIVIRIVVRRKRRGKRGILRDLAGMTSTTESKTSCTYTSSTSNQAPWDVRPPPPLPPCDCVDGALYAYALDGVKACRGDREGGGGERVCLCACWG